MTRINISDIYIVTMSSSNTTSDVAVAPLTAKQHMLQENVIIMGSHGKPELHNICVYKNISGIVWRLLNKIDHGIQNIAENLTMNNSEAQRNIVMSGNIARKNLKSVSLDDVKNDDLFKLHVKEFVLTLLLNSLHHLHICLFVSYKIGLNFNEIAKVTYDTELKEIKTLKELEKLITGWKNEWSDNTIWPILTPKLCLQFSVYLLHIIKNVKENFIAAYLMRANLNFVLVSNTVRDIIGEEIISKVLLNKNKLEVFIIFFYHLMCLCTRPTSNHYNWFKLVLSCIPIALFSVDDLKRILCTTYDNNSVNGWVELVNFGSMHSYDTGNPLLGQAAENKLISIKKRVNDHIGETVSKKLEQGLAALAKATVAEVAQAAQPVVVAVVGDGDVIDDVDDDDDDDDDDDNDDDIPYTQLVGGSASECDTIPGRQCMAACFFLLKQFDDVLLYLNSIKSYYYNDDTFNFNYGQAKASVGNFQEAEEIFLNIANEKIKNDYTYISWLAR